MTDPKPVPILLIAEDDPDDQLMLREAFADRCIECRMCFAHDGVQLMRILNGEEGLPGELDVPSGCPDLILLDLNMPLKDGREALREIKSDPRLRQIPTIVMTTSDDEEDIRYCYDMGANSYIIKPSSYSGLLDVVSSLTSYWATTVTLPRRPERYDRE
ncbi:two-component system response regulator [Marinobacter vulgaris]|uniref:Two-component system response regulator n=1 Tax=Marinobacter vulgaris TaxID=1928331 RepID=A0A2V3ZNJ0_9GAMM|nr:response regulator [Marinobacter vulgaris]PXX92503.1 two-component system response regulator [Marinobacter vulgaris]TSJ71552.1 response regulator [Marinobacter vulgaris]